MLGHSSISEKAVSETPGSLKCHCGEWRFKNAFFVVDQIREEVCRDLPIYGEIDGKHYCVLHYPSKEKVSDFQTVLHERLQEEGWNFKMVYFPSSLKYEREVFEKDANFEHAIFAESIDFKYCDFRSRFDFFNTTFLENASFAYSDFKGPVNFNAADFQSHAHFYGVTFHSDSFPTFVATKFQKANFHGVTFDKSTSHRKVQFVRALFSEGIDFSSAKFFIEVDFENAQFPRAHKAEFRSAAFHESASFQNVTFFDADFERTRFCESKGLVSKTKFTNCTFVKFASFRDAIFNQHTDFDRAEFDDAGFGNAIFTGSVRFRDSKFSNDAFFGGTKFGQKSPTSVSGTNVSFEGAVFGANSRVFFDNTWFSYGANFDYAKFEGFLFFTGSADNRVFDSVFEDQAWGRLLSFVHTTIEKPDKVYFQSVRLRPAWFVNNVFDVRKVNFIDVAWGHPNYKISIDEELKVVQTRINHNTKRLLAIAFRQIADNAESSNRFEEASEFRKYAFETERLIRQARFDKWWCDELTPSEFLLKLRSKVSRTPFDAASYIYRTTSFYGEDSFRAFKWLLFFAGLPALIYWSPFSDFSSEPGVQHLGFLEALAYSLRVMILQRPEPPPSNDLAKIVLALESFLAPIQLALLALALRRKFIR